MIRPLLFVLFAVVLQGIFPILLPRAWGFDGPDLFLLLALIFASRLPMNWGMLVAFVIGLFQDALGAGLMGLHATALSGAVYLFYGARVWLSQQTPGRETVCLILALIGQWTVFLFLTYWLRSNLVTVHTLYTVLPSQVVFTLLFTPLMYRFADWSLGRVATDDRRL